uniref:NADH-ubiquinone oxidoreductase chain 4 n=1 Tax=Platygaster sp. ZJUH_2016029 TaxID=2496284 RepID=A0A3Q8UAD4_9HYME|nr:NADH dehydrogenase subunit 4 [Platygaster sp. ZJUH_2016029]
MMEFLFMFFSSMMMMVIMNYHLLMIWFQNIMFLMLFVFFLMNFNINLFNYWFNLYGDYGMDKVSLIMIILLLWISGLMFLSSLILNYKFYFNILMLMMLFSLIGLFLSLDLLSFYLFFEVSLIPIMLMIMGWGYQPERLISMFYLLIYTLIMSLPFLLMVMIFNNENFMLNFLYLYIYKFKNMLNFYLMLMMLMMFLVKLPIYFIHLWLPKAHVEAPIFGSMILAGVLLKMGGYGIMRFMFILMNILSLYNLILIGIIFIGSIVISLICLNQVDLKMLIAYSSVVHMGFMLCGGIMMYYWGLMGFFMMMISHGICSSGLFCLLNLSYKRLFSRSIIFNSGLILYFPKMSFMWFMFSIMNMASPPSLSLISEIYLIIGIVKINIIMIFLLMIISLFSSIYSIYLFSMTQHGINIYLNKYFYNTYDEFLLMLLHLIPMNLMFIMLWFFF